ncbi:hypothetical protein PSTEL_26280 [Paenibacillus stellifer]|uniref:Ferric oxidoreductase domain-containing protein n=1 Tax=Paenibacillus stellifer TaxID=169760 RepID=A0A089M117_9BACL|nr:hypothetical protein [Paenibacillus stellifer]AIQ66100.1 hypothetical protein PSTEL_26280 [Paenibacillus stellifer]
MHKNKPAGKTVWIPAAFIAVVSLLLIAYSFYIGAGGDHPRPPAAAAGLPPRGEREEGWEPFKLAGTLAVICGAASFAWLRFKKKLKSPSLPVKQLGKLLYKVHKFTGWTALALIAVHGGYYLITKFGDHNVYTGLAAFLVLLAIACYGFLIRRVRSPWVRKTHFFLSLLWIPLLLLHAGGSAIAAVIAGAAIWVLVPVVEKWTQPKTA